MYIWHLYRHSSGFDENSAFVVAAVSEERARELPREQGLCLDECPHTFEPEARLCVWRRADYTECERLGIADEGPTRVVLHAVRSELA